MATCEGEGSPWMHHAAGPEASEAALVTLLLTKKLSVIIFGSLHQTPCRPNFADLSSSAKRGWLLADVSDI